MIRRVTVKLRLRDKHAAELNRQARAVNVVWNYVNAAQKHMLRWDRWLSKYDLQRLTAGSSKELDLHAHTVQRVCHAYVYARKTHHKPYLRWRGRKSLGWVNQGHVSFDGEALTFRGVRYETTHLRDVLKPGVICAGTFNQDARGHWCINVPIEVDCADRAPATRVGIDLGLDTLAALSDGRETALPKLCRQSEAALAMAQRARKAPKRVRNIHAKNTNSAKAILRVGLPTLVEGAHVRKQEPRSPCLRAGE